MDAYKNISGVYAILGLVACDSFTQTVYIGSSIDVGRRLTREHFLQLKANAHPNKPLQHYYNKYGRDSLCVILLETAAVGDLLTREQLYLDVIQPFADEGNGFNLSRYAQACNRGRKATPETIKRLRTSHLGQVAWNTGKKWSSEHRQRLSVIHTGKKLPPQSAESKRKKSFSNSKKLFRFISPSGNTFFTTNLTRFAQAYNLLAPELSSIHSGKRRCHKGWTA